LAERIREHCLAENAEIYWVRKEKVDRSPATHIAWTALGTAMAETKLTRQHWVVKHSTGRCGVGRRMKLRREWTHSRCPRCGQDNETTSHVLRCRFPEATTLWQESVANLGSWLKTTGTHPAIQEALILRLNQWHDGTDLSPFHSNVPWLNEAVREQDSIGWESAMEGRWSQHWINIQNAYFKWKGHRNSGRRWLIAIIKRLWTISWDMWDHRNRVRLAEEQAAARNRAREAITAQFFAGIQDLLLQDRHLILRHSITELHRAPLFRQMAWIRRIKGCRRIGESLRTQGHQTRSRNLLLQWLDNSQVVAIS
jgi:hypothetical protein